jgi:hypothetical protein
MPLPQFRSTAFKIQTLFRPELFYIVRKSSIKSLSWGSKCSKSKFKIKVVGINCSRSMFALWQNCFIFKNNLFFVVSSQWLKMWFTSNFFWFTKFVLFCWFCLLITYLKFMPALTALHLKLIKVDWFGSPSIQFLRVYNTLRITPGLLPVSIKYWKDDTTKVIQ